GEPISAQRMGPPVAIDREPRHWRDECALEGIGEHRRRKDRRQRFGQSRQSLAIALGAPGRSLQGHGARLARRGKGLVSMLLSRGTLRSSPRKRKSRSHTPGIQLLHWVPAFAGTNGKETIVLRPAVSR